MNTEICCISYCHKRSKGFHLEYYNLVPSQTGYCLPILLITVALTLIVNLLLLFGYM